MPGITGGKERLIAQMRQDLLPLGSTFSPRQLYKAAKPLIELAVKEDVPDPDLVDARMIVDRKLKAKAVISANSEGIIAGGWLIGQVAPHYSKSMTVELLLRDGSKARARYDAAQVGEDRLSSVQYLKFQVAGRVPVALGTDLPSLSIETQLTPEQRAALAADLADEG